MTESMKRDIESCRYALCDDFEPFGRIVSRLKNLEDKEEAVCEWKDISPFMECFSGECGQTKTISPNEWAFCPNCGRRIVVKERE